MKTVLILAAAAMLGFSTAAVAQEVPAPPVCTTTYILFHGVLIPVTRCY
jgi:hypothetical protein